MSTRAIDVAVARQGARVFLSGRSLGRVDAVARDIATSGGAAEAAQVDALDEQAVEKYVAAVAKKAGSIDVSFNAISISQEGLPIATYTRAHFVTAQAAARHMVKRRSGVILTITATPARLAIPLVGGMAVAWAAVESLSRALSVELGPHGIRVVCLRPGPIPETSQIREVLLPIKQAS